MATLDPSNVINGNTIQASDIAQLYSAFGTGSSNITGLAMTGSLFGTGSWAVSSSHAISSSYADSSIVSQVNGQSYDGGGGVVTGTFKFIAGKTAMTTGAATSSAFPVLAGKVLGTNAFITANYALTSGPADAVIVTSISSSGAILFDNNSPGTPSTTVIFTGIYI